MKQTIYLAGGCFWGVEKYLSLIPGVLATEVGYANGITEAPTYEQVCRGNTGHAETVKVVYEDDVLALRELLTRFFDVIDPTSVNRQGNDRGVQYRTGIYYTLPEEREGIQTALTNLQARHGKPVVVEALPLDNYYPAEGYHQGYLDKNPGGYCHIPAGAFERAKRPPSPDCGMGLRQRLTDLQYRVTQEDAAGPAFQSR